MTTSRIVIIIIIKKSIMVMHEIEFEKSGPDLINEAGTRI
jgi:hypothetical protein